MIAQLSLPNFGHTVQRATIAGKPFLIVSGESPGVTPTNCPWAWGYLIDISDERRPRVVSELKLEVNEPQNCSKLSGDRVVYSIHYVGVDDERNTTKVFYSYYGGGLRVFDVGEPARPREIAYYHPPPRSDTVLDPTSISFGGDVETPTWDSVTSVIRYRPERGQIWVASIAGGLQILELTGDHACVPARAAASGRRFGAAALGRRRDRQRTLLAGRPRAVAALDVHCTTDAQTMRIAYATRRLAGTLPDPERRRLRDRAVLLTSLQPARIGR